MQIKLYSTSSEKNRLTKTLTGEKNITGNLQNACDVINPVIIVGYDSSFLTKNYAYIADFGRYYFITGFETDNKEIAISMHVDVLETYKTQIKNSTAHVVRSASNYDDFIIDDMIINKANTRTYQRKIGAGFTKADKYLMLIGG